MVNPQKNLLIKGNNLIACILFFPFMGGVIKLIYIDPPYNTGSDSFGYNDRFNRSSWLTFMKDRLSVAHKLLREDGVLFISIDDNEMHYLKVLCDEILGKNRFIATIPRKTRSGKADVPFNMSQDFDWLLVYSKTSNTKQKIVKRIINRKYYKSNDFQDEWRLNPLTKQTTTKERPNSDFTIINPVNGDKFPVNPNSCWRITKDTFPKYLRKNKIVFPGDYDFLKISKPMLRIFKSEDIAKHGGDWNKAFVSTDVFNRFINDLLTKCLNAKGTKEIIDDFGRKAFSYPKPIELIQKIVEISTQGNDIILDFFAGSGTTGLAVLKQNKADGGKRKFILVEQLDEHIEICKQRLQKLLKRENLADDFLSCELAKANQALIDKITNAKTVNALWGLWSEIRGNAFFKHEVNIQEIEDSKHEMQQLSLKKQQFLFSKLLDPNLLYIPSAEMADARYNISDKDQGLSLKFYGE